MARAATRGRGGFPRGALTPAALLPGGASTAGGDGRAHLDPDPRRVHLHLPAAARRAHRRRRPFARRPRAAAAPSSRRREAAPGYVRVERQFRPGDSSARATRRCSTWPDARVAAVRGQVAVEPGPVVVERGPSTMRVWMPVQSSRPVHADHASSWGPAASSNPADNAACAPAGLHAALPRRRARAAVNKAGHGDVRRVHLRAMPQGPTCATLCHQVTRRSSHASTVRGAVPW